MKTVSSGIQPTQNGSHCQSCDFFNRCVVGNLQAKNNINEFSRSLGYYEVRRKGGYIFNQGQSNEGVYFLCSGLIKLVAVLESGQEVILDLLLPSTVIGVNPIGARMQHMYSAVTVSQSARIAYAKQSVIENWMRSQPAVGEALFHDYWQKLERSQKLISHRVLDVRARFLLFLGYHMSAFEAKRGGELLEIHLSREELAQLVQTTPETISRLLHCLRDDGMVAPAKGRGMIVIKSKILHELLAEHNDASGSLM
jgi:CRP/FNR family transcriptional regulator